MRTPNVVFNLANSEKFWYVTLLYMLPLTCFAALEKITIQYWSDQALYAVGILVFGKTAQGVAATIANRGTVGASSEDTEITKPNKRRTGSHEPAQPAHVPPPLPPASP